MFGPGQTRPLRSDIRLSLLAPLSALLVSLSWVVLGMVSPGYPLFDMRIEGYSTMSQPISGLGLGVTGPWMNTTFVVCGVLMAVGLAAGTGTWPRTQMRRSRVAARALLVTSGVGISMCGLFNLEAVLPHLVGFLLAVGAPGLAYVLAGLALHRVDPWLARLLLVAGPLTLLLLVGFMATFDPMSAAENQGVAGLVQRALISVSLATSALIGYRAWASQRAGARLHEDPAASGPGGSAPESCSVRRP
jgi:hypothetical protein